MRQFIAGVKSAYRRAKTNHRVTNAIYHGPRTTYRALNVEPQQVVLGQAESADRCLRFYPTVRPMPVVLMQPSREFLSTVVRRGVGLGISPFPEGGLDEALGLAIGFGCVGLGADVLDAELAA